MQYSPSRSRRRSPPLLMAVCGLAIALLSGAAFLMMYEPPIASRIVEKPLDPKRLARPSP